MRNMAERKYKLGEDNKKAFNIASITIADLIDRAKENGFINDRMEITTDGIQEIYRLDAYFDEEEPKKQINRHIANTAGLAEERGNDDLLEALVAAI